MELHHPTTPQAKLVAVIGWDILKPRISVILHPGNTAPWGEVRTELNHVLRGWSGYFRYGTCTQAYCAIDHYVATRVRHFLARRHKVPSLGTKRFADATIFGQLGVVRLRALAATPSPWALR